MRGTVLNYGGTAPIDKASVEISAPGYNYTTTTGPDGAFLFAGVPAGRFNLDAPDPGNGLQGRTSGTITYEGETAATEIRIAPTGAIEGRVLLPDGVTPAVNARVTFQGKPVLVDPATGGFAFDNLALGSYSLTAYELNTHRAGNAIVTLSRRRRSGPCRPRPARRRQRGRHRLRHRRHHPSGRRHRCACRPAGRPVPTTPSTAIPTAPSASPTYRSAPSP